MSRPKGSKTTAPATDMQGFPKTIFLLKTDKGFQAYLKDEIPAGKDEVGKLVAVYKFRKGSIGTITVKPVAVIESNTKS